MLGVRKEGREGQMTTNAESRYKGTSKATQQRKRVTPDVDNEKRINEITSRADMERDSHSLLDNMFILDSPNDIALIQAVGERIPG